MSWAFFSTKPGCTINTIFFFYCGNLTSKDCVHFTTSKQRGLQYEGETTILLRFTQRRHNIFKKKTKEAHICLYRIFCNMDGIPFKLQQNKVRQDGEGPKQRELRGESILASDLKFWSPYPRTKNPEQASWKKQKNKQKQKVSFNSIKLKSGQQTLSGSKRKKQAGANLKKKKKHTNLHENKPVGCR